MNNIFEYISNNCLEWITMLIFAIIGICYRKLLKAINEDRVKNRAVAQGVEALLRDRIIDSYHKYEKKESCPVYAKENVKRLYEPYHKLGGNDVATELVDKIMEMPT